MVNENNTDRQQQNDTYSSEEQEAFRAQMRRANADARAEIERRYHLGPHPRVQALMDAGLWPKPYPGRSNGGDQ